MPDPTTRSFTRRVLAVVLAAAAAAAACGGDDVGDDAGGGRGEAAAEGATTTTTTSPTFTLDDLGAALPTEADLPAGHAVRSSCRAAGQPDCPAEAPKPMVHVLAGASGFNSLAVNLTLNPDPETAVDQLESARQRDASLVGTFDIPVSEREDGSYTPGRRGEGTSEDVEIDGWTGYRLVARFEGIHRDGSSQPGRVEARIALSRGNAVIDVQADSDPEAAPDAAADDLVQQLAEVIVADLD